MTKEGNKLFVTDVSKESMWVTYLESFPEGTNEIYRERREFDCNCCKSFIRKYGNMVTIGQDNNVSSIWDIEVPYPFDVVTKSMSEIVKSKAIRDVFLCDEKKLGTKVSREIVAEGPAVVKWEHFYLELPPIYINRATLSVGTIMSEFRTAKVMFKKSMDEFTYDAGVTILELIAQNSIYRGLEHKSAVEAFCTFKDAYEAVPEVEQDNWCWKMSSGNPHARIRNSVIGTLLEEVSMDVDLDEAVKRFETKVAPANYKRPKAVVTKKQIELAEKKIVELGYADSTERKFAVIGDITVNNVIYSNKDAQSKMKKSVFAEMKTEVGVNPKTYGKVEEIGIEDFIENVLPYSHSLEVLVENRHEANLMSLIAPVNVEAKSMLKWDNNFSLSYNGDLADSMKQNVKSAGGNVNGDLRFSIQWNENGDNQNDFDAHCIEANGTLIYYPNAGKVHSSSGILDVDIQYPSREVAVENIIWTDKRKMKEGLYKLKVHNFSHRGGTSGFRAEIEFDGQIFSFDYPYDVKNNAFIDVATIKYSKETGFTMIASLDNNMTVKEIWNVKTNNFVKVPVFMYSPNYWDGQEGIGNKHYLFMLDGCINEGTPRGFFNEFLDNSLMEHKRVFEILGSKMRVEPSTEQLSGIGFSSTQSNSIVVKVTGSTSRILKIKF